MLNYRIQSCIDSDTYRILEKYKEEKGYDTISVTVRKILSEFLNDSVDNEGI